jgi:hypothetical protein
LVDPKDKRKGEDRIEIYIVYCVLPAHAMAIPCICSFIPHHSIHTAFMSATQHSLGQTGSPVAASGSSSSTAETEQVLQKFEQLGRDARAEDANDVDEDEGDGDEDEGGEPSDLHAEGDLTGDASGKKKKRKKKGKAGKAVQKLKCVE